MKTLFAVSFAFVAALLLAVSPAWAEGSPGFAHRPSVFPRPVDHWAHWGKPAHGHQAFRHHGHVHKPSVSTFTVPHFTVPRPVIVRRHAPVVVVQRHVWVPGFWTWSGFYWVWIPGHWR